MLRNAFYWGDTRIMAPEGDEGGAGGAGEGDGGQGAGDDAGSEGAGDEGGKPGEGAEDGAGGGEGGAGGEGAEGKKTALGGKPGDGEGSAAGGDEGGEGEGDDGGKGDDKSKATDGAPEQYEPFRVAEGVDLDTDRLQQFTQYAKSLNLTQDQAQEMMNFGLNEIINPMLEESAKLWQKTTDGWLAELKSDPDVGGPDFEANMDRVGQMIDHVLLHGKEGDELKRRQSIADNLRTRLNETGFGNEPGLGLILHLVSSLFDEDSFTSARIGTGSGKTGAQAMYPSMANP